MSAVPVQRPALRVITLPTTTTGVRNAPSSGTRAALPTGGLRIGGGVVRPQSLALGGSQAGTGINPWWRYAEENIPGKQHMMVNVGTGNVIIDADDMSIPHKGISLAFRRTYNSQSMHDVNGTDGSVPSMYGNGWTNTFDAHISGTPTGSSMTVWDIDGAQYTYTPVGTAPPGKPIMTWTAPAGKQGTTFVSDGACTFFWTKKTGTIYQFYRPDLGTAAALSTGCSSTQSAYAGRIVAIFGRNNNTAISFTYSWDNGNAGAGGKVSQMVAAAESGLSATLSFADFGAHRLLSKLAWPDGTAVVYNYDSYGDLITAHEPPNNAAGTQPTETYSYGTAPAGFQYLYAVAPPRWNANDNGSYVQIDYNFGSTPATSTIAWLKHNGYVNITVNDGFSNGAIQPIANPYTFLTEYYTIGATSTYRDTDGHMTNWLNDSSGRATQTQECTASSNQGQQCTGTWLATNDTWDANDNLTEEMLPNGSATNYDYDANGNAVAVAAPLVTTTAGSFRPTKLYSYDAYNNVIAYCDEVWTHNANKDWTGNPGPSDALCPTQSGAESFTYQYPSQEPYGELVRMTTPLGYHRAVTYATGSGDFGLPLAVTGDQIGQSDGTRIPYQSFAYDPNGNLICYTANGSDPTTTTVLAYDSVGRVTAIGDPDDASLPAPSGCVKTPGIAGSSIVHRMTYFPSGLKATDQTPSEAAASVSTQYTYDSDGDELTEQKHYTSGDGTTTKWYDGEDRLVEVKQPQDPTDFYKFPWMTRYYYDLTGGGTVTFAGSAPYAAYGNLYKTQEYASTTLQPTWAEAGNLGDTSGAWADTAGTTYDALDRALTTYRSDGSGLEPKSNTYDASGMLGLLTQTCNAYSDCEKFSYNARLQRTGVSFTLGSGTNSIAEPSQSFAYDPDGRLAAASNSVGSISDTYDADGRRAERTQAVAGKVGTITYHYYGDGQRSALDISAGGTTIYNALTYTYRPDLAVRQLTVPAGSLTFAYTGGKRLTSRADSTTATPNTITYTTGGGPSSYGLATSMTTPSWYETSAYVAYNAEGEQTEADYYNAANPSGALEQARYTSRGELAAALTDLVSSEFANGFRLQGQRASASTPKTASVTFNSLQGRLVSITSPNTCSLGSPCQPDVGGVVENAHTSSYAYDSVGRAATETYSDNSSDPLGESWTKHYDVENHLVQDDITGLRTSQKFGLSFSLSYLYGPLQHPFQVGSTAEGSQSPFQYESVYWDDDTVLFTTNSNGAIDDVKVGSIADYLPGASAPLVVWDRDWNDNVGGCHDSAGPGTALEDVWQSVPLSCANSTGQVFQAPQFTSYTAPGYQPVGRGGLLVIPKSDGLSDGQNTFQGVRSYDPQAGQWNTPDAYAGDVRDPMTQKPYMWNRNNPYEYADPTGYDWGMLADNWQQLAMLTRRSPFVGFLAAIFVANSQPVGTGELPWLQKHAALRAHGPYADAVIGRFPNYLQDAAEFKLRSFNVPIGIWSQWTSLQQQSANDAWIQKGIQRRWTFLVDDANRRITGFLQAEIDQLLDAGYTWSDDSHTELDPPQRK